MEKESVDPQKPGVGESGSNEIPGGKERRSGKDRRQSVVDRRSGLDRRRNPPLPNLQVKRGAGIRRTEERRAAEEGEFTDEQFEFIMAIEEYKRINKRPFPTWTEVLEVIKKLGYRKVAPMEVDSESAHQDKNANLSQHDDSD